jgi:diguanylate cyclase (GGDEF)-like protein
VQSEHHQHRGSSLVLNAPFRRIATLPRGWLLVVGLACTVAIALLDYITGPRVLLNIFYLLPVMLVAWGTGSTGYGLIVAVTSCLATPVEAVLSGFRLDSLPVALWNGAVRLSVFCIVLYLMEKVHDLMTRLQEQALSDELTGLANLRAFHDVAAKEIERSRRFDHELSLAYIDIDDFKGANDRLGHEAGDRMLIALASLALATVRSVDTVARIGGDEFVIVMPETGADAALPLVTRLREAFSRVATVGAAAATCSIGLASFARPPESVEELLTTADALMYEAKAGGRDGVRHTVVHAGSHNAAQGRLLPFSPTSRA